MWWRAPILLELSSSVNGRVGREPSGSQTSAQVHGSHHDLPLNFRCSHIAMKTSIAFKSPGPAPVFLVEGKAAGLVRQIDLELNMTNGTMQVDMVHVTPYGRHASILTKDQPNVPKHPCVKVVP